MGEKQNPLAARVHKLEVPVKTSRIRVVVSRVVPVDNVARVRQVEAWGPAR